MDRARIAVRPLTADARTPADVGRQARLEMAFVRRDGRTVLEHAYAEPPLRVGPSFARSDGLDVILTSSAPGIFAGDAIVQQFTVREGADVKLTSQSALQVHPGAGRAAASLRSHYRVERGGRLSCFWHPVIPFAASRIDQRITIDLDEGAGLSWSDAVMAGREARGERWQFDCFDHELRLTIAGVLVYLERYRLEPSCVAVDRRWAGDSACYFGTMLVVRDGLVRDDAEGGHRAFEGVTGLRAAVDLIEPRVMMGRMMSASGVAFHDARARFAELFAGS